MDGVGPHHLIPTVAAWDSMFILFSAEVGAKSFIATGFFAIWCPLSGLRKSDASDAHQIVALVFAGALLAMCSQVFVYKSGLILASMHGGLNLVLLLGMCYVAAKVFEDLTFADEREKMILRANERQRAQQEPHQQFPADFSAASPPTLNEEGLPMTSGNPFMGSFKPYDPSTPNQGSGAITAANENNSKDYEYGSVEEAGIARDGMDERPSNDSKLAAFAIPFGVVYILEANDKMWHLLKSFENITTEVAYGICLGYLLSSLCATFSGLLIARFLSESRKLFVIVCWIISMLITTSSEIITEILKNTFRETLFAPETSSQSI